MGDLISRQATLKNAHFPMIDDAGYEVVRVDDILALPSAEPKTARTIYNFLKKKIGSKIIDNPFEFEGWYNRMIWHVQEYYKLQKKYEVGGMAKPNTGRWIWDDKGYFYCDQCGKKPNDQTRTTDYCPNCGSYNGG